MSHLIGVQLARKFEMWVYWLLFLVPAYQAITKRKQLNSPLKFNQWTFSWYLIFFFLVAIIGWRHEVGGDWIPYKDMVETAKGQGLLEVVKLGDPAYSLLNWIASKLDIGVYFVNTICAFLFTYGLLSFCLNQPRPWLSLVVAVPYLITVVGMGYSRQGVAIGLVMLGFVSLSKRNNIKFLLFVCLAILFHQSAVLLIPMLAISSRKNWLWSLFWTILLATLFVFLIFQSALDRLINNYLLFEYDSSGAMVRVVMNALPAILFLTLRKRFKLALLQERFWTLMSYGGIFLVFLLYISPSSTAVDRVALYWIPLQLFILSRLPDALGGKNNANFWVYLIVVYSGLVHYVWLFYASFSYLWIPYQFYPLVLLWN